MDPLRPTMVLQRWRENRVKNADQKLATQSSSPAQEKQAAKAQQRAGPEQVVEAQIEQGRQAFRERYEAYQRERAPTVPEPKPEPKQEQAVEKQEQEIKIDRGFGIAGGELGTRSASHKPTASAATPTMGGLSYRAHSS